MTPLQQAYLNRLRATAEANAAFFEMNMPAHKLLLNEAPSATVDISDQGDLFIRYGNGDSKPVVAEMMRMEGRLEKFADLADRPQILAFHKLRDVRENPSHGHLQRYHYSNLDAEFPNRVTRHFVKHFPDNSGLAPFPTFGDKEIPLLIVFGSGLGWHLPRLLLEYRIRHLIVIETNTDDFRLSVFFQDYVSLSCLARERGTDLVFIVQEDVEKIARSLMAAMLRSNGLPQFFIHGAALFYAVDEDDMVTRIRAAIIDTLWELFFGMGYFDDELITIQHSFDNLQHGFPIHLTPDLVNREAVAFIVGSGPSLDMLIPILREYGDRAVIFSCGTAISILHKMGIRPDFHVEKERQQVVHDILVKSIDGDIDFLKGVHFIGLNTVHSDVYRLFERRGMIIKAADTMGSLVEQAGMPTKVILSGQPTVANTALDFALSVGFRKIFLFGVDMGSRDREKHHSKHTVYINKLPEEDHLKSLLSNQPANDIVVPGNFGGEVSTNKVLSFARRMTDYAILRHADTQVFNLNDGALIEQATPLRPEDFASKWQGSSSKIEAIEAALASFANQEFNLMDLRKDLLAKIDDFISQVEEIVDRKQDSLSDAIDKLIDIHRLTLATENFEQPCALLFRGTLSRLLSMAFNAMTIILDQEEALAKAEWDFSNIVDFLYQARIEVNKKIEEVLF